MGRLIAGVTLIAMVCTSLPAAPAKADTWRGTAPFCSGQCLPGEQQIATSKSGDGGTCWTGHKVLCRNSAPVCYAKQTKTSCAIGVLICENGYYKYPDIWVGCGKHACGVCAGWW